MPLTLALWEAEEGESLDFRSSRLSWPTWWNPISTKNTNTKISQVWWCAPVVPATEEAQAGESLEPGRWRLSGHQSKTLSQKIRKIKSTTLFHVEWVWSGVLLLRMGQASLFLFLCLDIFFSRSFQVLYHRCSGISWSVLTCGSFSLLMLGIQRTCVSADMWSSGLGISLCFFFFWDGVTQARVR